MSESLNIEELIAKCNTLNSNPKSDHVMKMAKRLFGACNLEYSIYQKLGWTPSQAWGTIAVAFAGVITSILHLMEEHDAAAAKTTRTFIYKALNLKE